MLHLTLCPSLDHGIQDLGAHMPPGGPASVLQPWHVVVAGSSAQRIVSQRLSHVLGASTPGVPSGVSANVQLMHPGWLNDLIRPVNRGEDAWGVQRMAWALMGLPADPGVRRWRMARRVADDLDRTQMWRPDVVLDWLERPAMGGNERPALRSDLADMMAYLRGQTAQPTMVEQAQSVIAAIRSGEPGLDTQLVHPERPLMLFGVNNLPVMQLSVLAAYAKDHEVYWWINTPMTTIAQRALEEIPEASAIAMDPSGTFLVRDPRQRLALDHYAKTGFTRANGRETVEGLRGVAAVAALAGAKVRTLDPSPLPGTVLGKVQRAIREDCLDDVIGPGFSEPGPGASVVRVACSRPQRQVEALRDYLLNLFMDDPTLQPRDVIVACPDPHAWEASVRRAFAPGAGRPNLRVRLLDPYARVYNPVRDVLARCLALVDGQLTRIQLIDLLAMEPVAAKFGFDEQAIEDLGAFLEATHMTWGLDPQDRQRFGLPVYQGGTLQDSIDQLALGLTRLDGGLDDLPALGVKPGHIEMIGRFFTAASVLQTGIARAREAQSVRDGWVPLMVWLAESLCWVDFDHGWQMTSVLRELNRLAEVAQDGPADVTSREFAEIFSQLYAGGGRRGDIGSGDLIITSMAQARGMHHRVVCFLGMDEGRVPRPRSRVGVAEWGAERIGDRDAATNDRQSWLDLLAGCAERVAVFWSAPPQGGEAHPSVMVTDLNRLLDDLGATPADGLGIRHAALHRWGVLDHQDAPSPDQRAAELASINYQSQGVALTQDRLEQLRLDQPEWPELFTLADLVRFGLDPLHAYARHTLGIGWLGNEDEPDDVVINASDGGLAGWAVNDAALRTDLPTQLLVDRAIRSGLLPMRQLCSTMVTSVDGLREGIDKIRVTEQIQHTRPVIARINLDIPTQGGQVARIIDRVRVDRRDDGTYALINVTASSYKRRAMWELWVRYLALAATFPDHGVDIVYVSKVGRYGFIALGFTPVSAAQAVAYLTDLMNTVEIGLAQPLIAPIGTALDWAKTTKHDPSVIRKAWEGSAFGFDLIESQAGSVVRLIGGNLPAEWVVDQRVGEERHVDVVAQGLWKAFLAHLTGLNPELKGR